MPARIRARWRLVALAAGTWALAVPGGVPLLGQGTLAQRRIQPQVPDSQALSLQQAFGKVAESVKPAVVSITTTHSEFVDIRPFAFGDPLEEFLHQFRGEGAPGSPGEGKPEPGQTPRRFEHRFKGLGSGLIIDPRGYILTNEHVVRDADKIKVTVLDPDERIYTGKVLGKDTSSDLAVVKIQPRQELSYLTLGDSSKVNVGDWAIAVGSPFGLEQTVTVGVISANRQALQVEDRQYTDFFQTDAAINRGNSGGPLVNISGQVIGINTAIYGPTGVFAGIGFAIPSNQAKYIMDQLLRKGKVVRGWMGVEIIPLDAVMARQFGVPEGKGALLNLVLEGSPAGKAGLQRGDVITGFNGRPVASPEELIDSVSKTPPKTQVTLDLVRGGAPRRVSLTMAEKPPEPEEMDEEKDAVREAEPETPSPQGEWEGALLRSANASVKRRAGINPAVAGVLVAGVRAGSAAQEMGLEPGDMIVSVNRKPTPDLDAFKEQVDPVDPAEGLLLDVNRRGRQMFMTFQTAS